LTEPTLYIFDIDGTLCNTKEIGDNCFIEVFEQMYHCQLKNIQWENFTHVTDAALYRDLYKFYFQIDPTVKETQLFKKEYYKQLYSLTQIKAQHFKLVKGANEFLLTCKQNNIPTAIATGSWLDIALLKMNACNLYFKNTPLGTSDDDYRRTGIVKSVIEKSKQFYTIDTYRNITYFGDGLWDFECCKQLNIDFIGIDIDNNGKLQNAGVKNVIANFSELIFWLKKS
jgi:phosphoglycolate phosphatase-like HAD superfamily hydrolase